MHVRTLIISALLAAAAPTAMAGPVFVNSLTVTGNATDLSDPAAVDINTNRLGGFGSDLYYDRFSNSYYGLVDRGPGGGTLPYQTRLQRFTLDVNSTTGAISNFNLVQTIKFTDSSGAALNGLNPTALNGNAATLGNSFDPEGLVIGNTGNLYVSDEYGPSVKEFDSSGKLLRTFATPANLVPRNAGGNNFTDGRPTITGGRQDNRGFEGLTISPDGKTLYAALQDPLVNEGASNDGRNSRNVRIVKYDVETGASTGQFLYQLDDTSAVTGVRQGRNQGLSSITALNDHEFLVIERDNRGIGVDAGTDPVTSKKIYKIDITGATDISGVSLAGSNAIPAGVTPIAKTLYLDIQAALNAAGQPIGEKLEGLTFGPALAGGGLSMLLLTDNDFSVTQNGSNVQFNVCFDVATLRQVSNDTNVNSDCPAGLTLLPTFLYGFSLDADSAAALNIVAQQRVPEPASLALMGLGLLGAGFRRYRSR